MPAPTIGKIVHYRLTTEDAESVNVRRSDYATFQANRPARKSLREPVDSGHVAHVGNHVAPGDVYPAVVVRVFDGYDGVNLHVLLDGNDTLWATSRHEGTAHGEWSWPPRVGG